MSRPSPLLPLIAAGLLSGCALQPPGPTAPPQLIADSCPPLTYPEAAVLAGEEGTVELTFHLDKEGRITSTEVTRSSGHERLDRLTAEKLSECRFTPGVRRGIGVNSTLALQYTWTIHEDDIPIDWDEEYDPYPHLPDF